MCPFLLPAWNARNHPGRRRQRFCSQSRVGYFGDANFRVLRSENGRKAIELAGKTEGPIHLLLSDVDMPELSGPDLGQALKTTRPDIHVMLMSGGAHGNLLVLNYGWAYIQKPFISGKLVEMVNDVLHSPDKSQPGGQEFDSRKATKPDGWQ